jgi:hypothetical protein
MTAIHFFSSRLGFEPETLITVERMSDSLSNTLVNKYDLFLKRVKAGQGLPLGSLNLHTKFLYLYIRAAHSKEASLLNWARNAYDGTEVGDIRFEPWIGVGGRATSPIAYINNNMIPSIDNEFYMQVKWGGYVSEDFKGFDGNLDPAISGAQDTRVGANAHYGILTPRQAAVMQSWGQGNVFFIDANKEGLYEAVRGVTGTNQANGNYNGFLNTNTLVQGVRHPPINWYSLARNRINGSIGVSGTPFNVNDTGFCRFEYFGSNQINSPELYHSIIWFLNL